MLKQILSTEPATGDAASPQVHVTDSALPTSTATPVKFDRKHPFPARVLENRRLDAPESAKETRHLVLDLKGSNLSFEPGDALGIHAENSLETVDQIVELLGASGAEDVICPGGAPSSLREALLRECLITQPRRTVIELLAKHASHWAEIRELQKMLDQNEIAPGLQVIDLLATAHLRGPAPPILWRPWERSSRGSIPSPARRGRIPARFISPSAWCDM